MPWYGFTVKFVVCLQSEMKILRVSVFPSILFGHVNRFHRQYLYTQKNAFLF